VNVQIFGTHKDAATRKALRFFKERRIKVHFVDFKVRGPAKGELRRFAQKYGVEALIDRDSKRFQNLGLRQAMYGEERWLEILVEEPLILTTPLIRSGAHVSVGDDEAQWRAWVEQ